MLNQLIKKMPRLIFGFIMCSFAVAFMINANIGLSPWDVLHEGIAKKLGITMGTSTIVVGGVVVLIDIILGENIGWATVLNMILVGLFLDIILFTGIVPVANNVFVGLIMLCIGMLFMAIGMVLYIGCGLGSGPRDGMMIALQKRINKPVVVIRGTMEVGALIAGYILGGSAGFGTVITALGLGYFIQIVFKICNFKSEDVVHRVIIDDINYIKEKHNNKANNENINMSVKNNGA
ncbi:YczE/YyaS/YitT family protein [Clostridium sp.]|uniref:YczE/YyaS/YitT family protein n=1 Tax=Clostridium sp. TaxID=1506 RepID=UPI003F40F056